MSLTPGIRLGPYEILGPLGAGGMGEVYRAKDTRLGREVAVKVLPLHLSAQPEIRARFEREAKTVSSLNHPNICVLFDVGREGDVDYLVMELVEGDTLAVRLKRGPLPAAELLRVGVQIADALDRAHRAGVIHRDLKPGNVMLTKSGAKLMDFGLARATGLAGPASGSGATLAALTQSPTQAHALTAEGTLLGTFQYMSPEQLEGRDADARGDIWALGCVLYEMATGRRAFEGRSQASLIAAILEREPAPVGEAPSGSALSSAGGPPSGLERLIRNCLAKDPDDRVQTAHDVKLQLQGIAESAGVSGTSTASTLAPAVAAARARRGGARLAWAVAAVAFAAAALAGFTAWRGAHAPAPGYRFHADTAFPGIVDPYWPRLSPDGRSLLFQASDSSGTARAWVRRMDEVAPRSIPGTEGLQRAYWSPDSREIVFVAGGEIRRLAVAGGAPVVVCPAPGGADLSWGSKGTILMDGQQTDSLRAVPAGGGELQPATRIDRAAGEIGSAWPSFLPDGEHFLFIGVTRAGTAGGDIRLGRLGSLDSKLLGKSDGRVEWAPGGWVLFLHGTSLLAQKLDLGAAKLTGPRITITDDVLVGQSNGHFTISRPGAFAFEQRGAGAEGSIYAADRRGALLGAPMVSGFVSDPRPSADGKRLLYLRNGKEGGGGDVNVLDLEHATDTRLTFTGGLAQVPEWSPDGRRFAYMVPGPAGTVTFHIGSADGLGGQDSIPVASALGATLTQWAAAGSRLVFFSRTYASFAVPTEGGDRAHPALLDSSQQMADQRVSPDGRWLAGSSGNAPNVQVYVRSLTGPPGRWQISNTGGIEPRWTRGGRELVYEGWDGRLMAVDVETSNGFHAGTPHPLFTLPQRSFAISSVSWGVAEDGERFYLVVQPRGQISGSIEVVTDFASLVHRK